MDVITIVPGESDDQRDIRMNKDIAAFSYVWIMSVVIFFTRKDSKFIRYHSKQGMILFFISILLGLIPIFGHLLLFIPVAGMLLGFVNAAQGLYADVPIVGALAKGDMSVMDALKEVVNVCKWLYNAILDVFRKHGGPKNEGTPPPPPNTPPTPPVDNPPPPPVG